MSQRYLSLPLNSLSLRHSILLFVLLAAVSAAAAQNNAIRGLYITGQYHYAGELPSEMKGLFSVNLIANDSRGRKAPLTGDVVVSGQGRYKFASAQLDGDRLTFTTRALQGVNYKFDGKILKVRSETDSSDEPQLEGTLTKLKDGQKAGELTGRFTYEEFGD